MLMLHPGSLGDFLLALPALQGLRRRFPHDLIHWVAHPSLLRLFRQTPWYDSGTSIDSAAVAQLFSSSPPLDDLPFPPLDAAVCWLRDPEGQLSSNFRRLGARQLVVQHPLSDPSKRHRSELFWESLSPLGVFPGSPMRLVLSPKIQQKGEELLRSWQIPPSMILHPGSGGEGKRWRPALYGELGDFLSQRGYPVVVLEGPAEPGWAGAVAGAMTRPVRVASGLDLESAAGLLGVSLGFVGNDSGLTHLAAALGIRTLALFKATDPLRWGPRGEQVRIETEPSRWGGAIRELFDVPFC